MTQKNGDAPIWIASKSLLDSLIAADAKQLSEDVTLFHDRVEEIRESRRTYGRSGGMIPVKFILDPKVDPVNPFVQEQVYL